MDASVKPLSGAAAATNAEKVSQTRHLAGLSAGIAAGALRLESLTGVALYAIVAIITTILLAFSASAKGPHYYFESPIKALCFDGVFEAVPGFVLAWVLVYGLVET